MSTLETHYALDTALGSLVLVPRSDHTIALSGILTIPERGRFGIVARLEPGGGTTHRIADLSMRDTAFSGANKHERLAARKAILDALAPWKAANPGCFLLAREAELRWQYKCAIDLEEAAKQRRIQAAGAVFEFTHSPEYLAFREAEVAPID